MNEQNDRNELWDEASRPLDTRPEAEPVPTWTWPGSVPAAPAETPETTEQPPVLNDAEAAPVLDEVVREAQPEPGFEGPAPGWREMRFAQEEPRRSYSDAGYVPAQEAAVPRTYHCAPQTEKRERKPKRERRGVSLAGVIAACLVCAILGGVIGGFLPSLVNGGTQETRAATESGTVLNVAAPASTPAQVSTNLITDSREKTATELYYDVAVHQTVAITTEITYTNIWGYTSSGAVKGSGFILSSDGYIMTNHHVIEDAVKGGYEIKVLLYDGSEYVADVVGYEEDNDVAVLKIDAAGLNAVTLGNSDDMKVGEQVYAVGNPLGELEFSMTSGMVSATDREISTGDSGISTTISMFQIDAPINSGNSGGPVYNSRGEVIGIATAKYSSTGVEGLGFAIPINDAAAIAQDLITDGYVHGKASFGITAGTVTAAAAQYYGLVEGAIVGSVTAGSAADKAGLKESDIIVAVDGKTIASQSDLVSAKRDYRAGDTVELKVYRGGEYLTLSLTFDEEAPSESAQTQTQTQTNNGGTGGQSGFGGFFGGYPFN